MQLGNPKNVLWEALLLTAVVFILGLFLGIALESERLGKVNNYYAKSEISMIDILAFSEMIDSEELNCENLILHNLEFADKIYNEALLLEKYEESGKITNQIFIAHQKYDLLRTFLWDNVIKAKEKCKEDFSYVVYLYEYKTKDLTKKATYKVWSRVLFDLKGEFGNKIILLSIAVDNDLISLNYLISKFKISKFPAVVIDGKIVLYELSTSEELEKYIVS